MTKDSVKGRSTEAMLKKAQNRERIAQCKLERLKTRFDRLEHEKLGFKRQVEEIQDDCLRLAEELLTVKAEKSKLEQEASMWRTQLFERMELLDLARDQVAHLKTEKASLEEQAQQARETSLTSHQELKRRDRERKQYEMKIEELETAQKQSRDQTEEILEALTDAKRAIDSLQRSNDYYQREIVGLKSIGASVTEKLTKMTQQRDRYKQRLNARSEELRLEQDQSAHLLSEVERLKDELYEVRGKLMTYQIEDDVREIRQAGADKASRAAEQKFAELPIAESEVHETTEPRSLISRATKKVSGWFRISDN
ncbi:MAG: hypothetical protein KC800_18470 [Candidatus Eremiobacteraeota bacterium]|nr:hypothetical protein [Candidatus Eremiobacteraeota bacterium]